MRKIVPALLLGVIVMVSGCTSQAPAQDQMPSGESETPDTGASEMAEGNQSIQTIYYTSSGFQPADVTIQRGETVVWVNNASSPMWVASDRHPTHTQYAGSSLREHCSGGDQTSAAFDQCSSGERFSFTFEKTGEWGYHNHERSAYGGTVTVVE